MKNKIILVIPVILFFQVGISKANVLSMDTVKTHFKILYLLLFADKPSMATENAFIDPGRVEHMNFVADSSAKEICRLLKVDNIMTLKIIPKTPILSLNDVFKLYNIRSTDKKLPIKIDENFIIYPETISISKNQIETVRVINRKYIHIILTGYYKIKKEDREAAKKGLKRSL